MVETDARCARCAQGYCDSCLVDFMGQRFCGPCRDYRLYELQHPGGPGAVFGGTGTVDLGRWIGAGGKIIGGDIWTWVLAAFLAGLITLASCGLLYGPMMAGMQMMAFRKMTYGTVEINNLFDGFRRFLNSFLLMTLRGIAIGGIIVGLYALIIGMAIGSAATSPGGTSSEPPLWFMGAYLAFYPAAFFFCMLDAILNVFTLSHIAARNASPIEALSLNFNVIKRNPGMFLLFAFLLWLIELFGAQICYVGLLFTTPLVAATRAQAYADHFGIDGWDRV